MHIHICPSSDFGAYSPIPLLAHCMVANIIHAPQHSAILAKPQRTQLLITILLKNFCTWQYMIFIISFQILSISINRICKGCPKKMHFENAVEATVHWLNHK